MVRTVVILAGGRSRRMGCDKALVRLGGERLIDRVIARIAPQAERLLISGPESYGTGLPHVPDCADAPEGPAAAVFSLQRRLSDRAPGEAGFVTVPVDGPFLPPDLVARLTDGAGAAIASDGANDHPTFAFWTFTALTVAWPLLRDRPHIALKGLAQACGARRVVWRDAAAFLNINTADDLARAEERLRGAGGER